MPEGPIYDRLDSVEASYVDACLIAIEEGNPLPDPPPNLSNKEIAWCKLLVEMLAFYEH